MTKKIKSTEAKVPAAMPAGKTPIADKYQILFLDKTGIVRGSLRDAPLGIIQIFSVIGCVDITDIPYRVIDRTLKVNIETGGLTLSIKTTLPAI